MGTVSTCGCGIKIILIYSFVNDNKLLINSVVCLFVAVLPVLRGERILGIIPAFPSPQGLKTTFSFG